MAEGRDEAVERILERCGTAFDITRCSEGARPLVAVCEYFARHEKYVISRKASLWSAETEEFMYVYSIDRLTFELFSSAMTTVTTDGIARANIGPGHMSTTLTALFICDECEDAARNALSRYRFRKSFRFSLHGWAEARAGLLETGGEESITTSRSGRDLRKLLSAAKDTR